MCNKMAAILWNFERSARHHGFSHSISTLRVAAILNIPEFSVVSETICEIEILFVELCNIFVYHFWCRFLSQLQWLLKSGILSLIWRLNKIIDREDAACFDDTQYLKYLYELPRELYYDSRIHASYNKSFMTRV